MSGSGRKVKNVGEFFERNDNEVTAPDEDQFDLAESEKHKIFPLAFQL